MKRVTYSAATGIYREVYDNSNNQTNKKQTNNKTHKTSKQTKTLSLISSLNSGAASIKHPESLDSGSIICLDLRLIIR